MAKMTKAEMDAWKKKNFDRSIKVPDAVIKQLLKGTKASNIAAANKPGASAQYKEAVRRFYGKNTVKSTTTTTPKGPSAGSPNTREPRIPVTVTPNQREDRRSVPYVKPKGGPGEKPRPPRPSGGPGAKPLPKKPVTPNQREGRSLAGMTKTSTSKGTGNTKRVNKPLIDLPKMLSNSQANMTAKAKANAAAYEKRQKAAQDKKNKK